MINVGEKQKQVVIEAKMMTYLDWKYRPRIPQCKQVGERALLSPRRWHNDPMRARIFSAATVLSSFTIYTNWMR